MPWQFISIACRKRRNRRVTAALLVRWQRSRKSQNMSMCRCWLKKLAQESAANKRILCAHVELPPIEAARSLSRGDSGAATTGQLYRDWGIPTPIAVVEAGTAGLPLIATGGIRSGLDAARALALGATLVGMGFPFLKAASESYDMVCDLLETTITQLKVAMQLSGAATIQQLHETDVVVTGATREWLFLRGFEDDLKSMAQRRWRHMHLDASL